MIGMLGVTVNAVAIIIGAVIGLLFKKGVPEKINTAVMSAIGLCVIFVGLDGIGYDKTIVIIVSMVLGSFAGSLFMLEDRLNALGDRLLSQPAHSESNNNLSQGFVSATLVFCVGAMAITGANMAGASGDNSTLYTKAIIDFVLAISLTVSLGSGVALSSIPVIIYEGILVVCAMITKNLLPTDTLDAVNSVGSLIIMAIGLNLTGITKFKIADFLPALAFAPLINLLFGFVVRG